MAIMSSMAANNPDLRAQQLVSSYVRAGYTPIDPPVAAAGGAVPRPVRRGHPPAHVSHQRSARARIVPAARPHHSGVARLSAIAGGRQGRGLSAISAPVFRHREGAAAEFLQAGIESFGRQDKAAADAEMLALGLEATTLYGLTAPEIRIGDVGLFAAFVAALDLAPAWKRRLVKDFNRKWSLAHDLDQLALDRRPTAAGISGRARGARRLRSQGGASSRHRSSVDRRHRRGRRPLGRRDRRALPRTGGARRRHAAAARDPRADRALPRRARRSRRGRRRIARARRRRQARARAGARSVRNPHRLSRRARRRRAARSTSRPRSAAASTITPASCSSCTTRAPRARWSPAAATTGC